MDKLNKLVSVIISAIILAFSISFFLTEKKEFSENEFRYLEKFPTFTVDSLLDGKYIESIEQYTTDHFPLREQFVSLKTTTFTAMLQTLINDVYIAKDGYLINRFEQPKNSDKIIEIINKFQKKNPDVKITVMLAPTATSIYQELLPKNNINQSEQEAIQYYYQHLNVSTIDIYDALLEAKEKYQLFYRTDHHWTSFGAYVAYQEFCKKQGMEYDRLDQLHVEKVSDKFLGTLYSKVFPYEPKFDEIYKINREHYDVVLHYLNKNVTDFYQEQYLQTKDKYSYFLGTNEPIIEIVNQDKLAQGELLIIKDSFANSLIPMLANHYQKIHVIDPRYYNLKISDYVKEHHIKDILLLYNIHNIDNDTGILNLS